MSRFLIFAFLIFLSCSSSGPDPVGIVFSRRPDILDRVKIRDQWNEIAWQNGIEESICSFNIRRGQDPESGLSYYFILGESADSRVKIARLLELKTKDFYFSRENTGFVICHPCETTQPVLENNQWHCRDLLDPEGCSEIVVALNSP